MSMHWLTFLEGLPDKPVLESNEKLLLIGMANDGANILIWVSIWKMTPYPYIMIIFADWKHGSVWISTMVNLNKMRTCFHFEMFVISNVNIEIWFKLLLLYTRQLIG